METIFPKKLHRGDTIRVVAPSCSITMFPPSRRAKGKKKLEDLGFKVTFGKHVEEMDELESSSVESRVADLHQAFRDPEVDWVLAVIGGFNCNSLFRYLNWDLIRENPKVFSGFSDTTALNNAIFAKTGLVNYSGVTFSSFCNTENVEYTLAHFKKCLMEEEAFQLTPSQEWADSAWWNPDAEKVSHKNDGYLVINEGSASGTILGSNLCTYNLLQGTEYRPTLENSILFLEDDHESKPVNFDRDLQSLIHLPDFPGVKGIVIGRFQNESKMTKELLTKIIKDKKELADIPVVANADFGHTAPRFTIPIGGTAKVSVQRSAVSITINAH